MGLPHNLPIPFFLDDMLESQFHLFRFQRSEPEPSAARLEGRDDLGEVVADQTETDVLCELFYHCTRGYTKH